MRSTGTSSGSVLALAILVLVALQLLAHGALVLARSEWASTEAGLRLLQARAGADAGAGEVQEGPTEAWDTVSVLGSTAPTTGSLGGRHPFRGYARRLSAEYWLIEGYGRASGSTWGVTSRRLVWRLDPKGRVAAVVGSVEVAGEPPDAAAVTRDPERPAFCRPWASFVDSVDTEDVWGRAVAVPVSTTGDPSLGRLGPGDLLAALPALAASAGTPSPVTAFGRCESAVAWNWGDPTRPGGPCGDRLVARATAGDLLLEAGVGQGILSVEGDLELSGTRFDGVVLVGGSLVLRDGAELRGMARVGSGVRLSGGSRILGSPCRALRVLAAFGTELGRALPVPEVGALDEGDSVG